MRVRNLKFWRMMPEASRSQRGITGLETAIVLIAFVVVSSVFAFAALSTGLFSSDKSKETINAGLEEASGTLEIRGSIISKANGGKTAIDEVSFQVANAAGGGAVDLTPGETLITYADASQSMTLTGDNFTVTEPGQRRHRQTGGARRDVRDKGHRACGEAEPRSGDGHPVYPRGQAPRGSCRPHRAHHSCDSGCLQRSRLVGSDAKSRSEEHMKNAR